MYVRRASFVLAITLAALALAPAPAAAQQASGPKHWALLIGVEDGPGDAGLQLRGDLEFPLRPLSPQVGFSIVGSVGFSRFGEDGGYYDYVNGFDNRWDWSVNMLKLVPAARFTFGHASVRPYVDAGLGIYYAGWSQTETVWVGAPYNMYMSQSYDDSEISLMMRFAGGVTFQVSPSFALGAELGFNPYFGDFVDDTFTSLMASATFRM